MAGDASVSLDLNAQQLFQELQNVQQHFAQFAAKTTQQGEEASKGFAKGFGGGFGNIGQNLAGALAGLGLGAEIKSVVEYGAKIEDLHQKFGVSTQALQKFGNAAEKNGGSLEGIAKAFRFLEVNQAKALGGSEAHIKAFAELGVSVSDLGSLRPEDIMLKIGASSANAADFVKILGKSALDSRVTLTGLADGTIQFGDAIADVDIAALKEADDAFKQLKQTVTILVGTGLGAFFEGVETVAGGLTGHIEALGIELKGLADAAKALTSADPERSRRILTGAGTAEDFKANDEDRARPGQILEKAKADADAAIERGYDATNEVLAEKKANREKKRDLGDPDAIERGGAGETDDQGRPLGKKGESQEDKEEKLQDRLDKAATERNEKDLSAADRLVALRAKAAEELSASTESRDFEDRAEAGLAYYDTLKDIDKTEKEISGEAKKQADDKVRAAREGLAAERTAEKRTAHDEERRLNPAGLSLKDIAENPLIGVNSAPIAQQALREEEAAKRSQLQGNLSDAAEHKNRAEELKKSLGLPNDIDKEKAFQDSLDKSEVLKAIRDNTKDMAANK
jgi:hypothetical protein